MSVIQDTNQWYQRWFTCLVSTVTGSITCCHHIGPLSNSKQVYQRSWQINVIGWLKKKDRIKLSVCPFFCTSSIQCLMPSIFKEVYTYIHTTFYFFLWLILFSFHVGKIQELRAELTSEKRDQKHQRKKTVMKKIVANMTMGNDMSPLFPDILNVMQVPVLEIKKMVYLYIINYARTKPDMAVMAISMFIKVKGTKVNDWFLLLICIHKRM